MFEIKWLRKLKKEPYSGFVKINDLSKRDIEIMFNIYSSYYLNTDYEIFEKDLFQKSGVFIIREPKKDFIVGFSTIMERSFPVNGKTAHAFFSGDTIIEEAYWGSRALQRAMFRYILFFKLKHTGSAIYWLLISKGFKTYLLLANNFSNYYPNPDQKNPELKDYVEAYCDEFFSEYYDNESKLINFGENYQALKPDVAPITDEMRLKNHKIAYFEKSNPTWVQGTELPCIGRLTWSDIVFSFVKFVTKITFKTKVNHSSKTHHENVIQNDDKNDESKVA